MACPSAKRIRLCIDHVTWWAETRQFISMNIFSKSYSLFVSSVLLSLNSLINSFSLRLNMFVLKYARRSDLIWSVLIDLKSSLSKYYSIFIEYCLCFFSLEPSNESGLIHECEIQFNNINSLEIYAQREWERIYALTNCNARKWRGKYYLIYLINALILCVWAWSFVNSNWNH